MRTPARRARPLALLAILVALSGCLSRGADPVPPTSIPDPSAHFVVRDLVIVPSATASRTDVYEDDPSALIRYTIAQPADAPAKEAAFVTLLLDREIMDVRQLELSPGQAQTFERSITDLRRMRDVAVEVRAGASSARAQLNVKDWPRAGAESLALGPLAIRADYGLIERNGNALVNLTLTWQGEATDKLRDVYTRMLCVQANGTIEPTPSVFLRPPSPGNSTSTDADIWDCEERTRYGLEFTAVGADDAPLAGRLLLVPRGWAPPHA